MLTTKQENFAKAVALKQMNYSDAYRDAYNTAKMKDRTINEKAYELAKDGDITVMIKELKEQIDTEIQKELVYTAVDSFNKLKKLQDKAETDNNINSALKAEELKGKLASLYVDKIDLKSQFSIVQGMRDFKNSQNRAREEEETRRITEKHDV